MVPEQSGIVSCSCKNWSIKVDYSPYNRLVNSYCDWLILTTRIIYDYVCAIVERALLFVNISLLEER